MEVEVVVCIVSFSKGRSGPTAFTLIKIAGNIYGTTSKNVI